MEEINRFNADILCFQEVDHYHDLFQPEISSKGFESIFKKKGDWHNDGLCIFYNLQKLKKINEFEVIYPGSQFAIGIELEYNNQRFFVLNTHLKAKEEFDDIRVQQVTCLLSYLQSLENLPIIICGDFNSLPRSNAYGTMFNNSIGLRSVYRQENEPAYTTVKMRKALGVKTEDYIWQRGFNIKNIISMPSLEEIGPSGNPGSKYPSDHFSLVTSLAFVE